MQDRLQVIDELDSSRAAEFRTRTSSEVYYCVGKQTLIDALAALTRRDCVRESVRALVNWNFPSTQILFL